MGKQRRQSNRGKPNRGGASGGRGSPMRGSRPNRGGGSGGGGRRGISIHDSQAADDVIAERAGRGSLSPQSSQAADDVIAGLATGEITARDVSNMPDEGRMSIPANMLPDAPSGYTWSEDKTLVRRSFYG